MLQLAAVVVLVVADADADQINLSLSREDLKREAWFISRHLLLASGASLFAKQSSQAFWRTLEPWNIRRFVPCYLYSTVPTTQDGIPA